MNKKVVLSMEGTTAAVASEDRRSWAELNPEILALIFVRIPADAMVRSVPFVCKPWMETVAGPYCWTDIDIEAWCRRRNDTLAVDLAVKKLVRRSNCTVQRLSAYRMGNTGFFLVVNCGSCLKVLQIPMSDITDYMILKHMKPLPNLTFLDISNCSKITSKGIAAFGNQCNSLIHLKRNMPPPASSVPIDDSEAKTIANTMSNLRRIELCYGRFGDSGLSEIVKKCKSLNYLDIQGSWSVELSGDLEEIFEKIEYFQSPWIDESDEFFGSDDDHDDDDSDESSKSD